MNTQLAAPDILRDEALERVATHNKFAVELAFMDIVRREHGSFTSEDVLAKIAEELSFLAPNAEPRFLGAAFNRASRKGFIRPTGNWVFAKRASRHRAPIREWESINPCASLPAKGKQDSQQTRG